MNLIVLIGSLVLVSASTQALSFTYKCKSETGKVQYTSVPCKERSIEQHVETMSINGFNKHYLGEDMQNKIDQKRKDTLPKRLQHRKESISGGVVYIPSQDTAAGLYEHKKSE